MYSTKSTMVFQPEFWKHIFDALNRVDQWMSWECSWEQRTLFTHWIYFLFKFCWIFYGSRFQVVRFKTLKFLIWISSHFFVYDSNFDLLCPYVFILKCLFFLLKWWTGETTPEILNFISHVFDILEHFHYLSHFRPLKSSSKVTHCEYTWIYLSKSSIWFGTWTVHTISQQIIQRYSHEFAES